MSVKLSSRPEAPWALWTGLAGGLAATVVSVMGILKSGSSTAAIGFIFVPFVAAIAAIRAAIELRRSTYSLTHRAPTAQHPQLWQRQGKSSKDASYCARAWLTIIN